MIKKIGLLVLCFTIFYMQFKSVDVYADEVMFQQRSNVSDNIDDLLGYAAYMNESNISDEVNGAQITSIFTFDESLIFESNGCVEYVDIIGTLPNGLYINLSRQALWTVDNEEIVSCQQGRIYTKMPGYAVITASYEDYSVSFSVLVQSYVDWEAYSKNIELSLIEQENNSGLLRSVPGPSLSVVMTRANNMAFVSWTPKQNFKLNDGSLAYANVPRKGVPYALKFEQYDDQAFLQKLDEQNRGIISDFYNINERTKGDKKVYDAQYGLDCSGFVSFAYGTPRCNTGTYRTAIENGNSSKYVKVGTYSYSEGNYDSSELKIAYTSLNVCDAVVNYGHVRLVIQNDVTNKKVTCIEAGGNSPYIATYTYNSLADEGYLPFTITNSYFSQLN